MGNVNSRGGFALHTSKRRPERFADAAAMPGDEWNALSTTAVVARLADMLSTDDRTLVESLSDQERAFGDYSPGRYAWKLEGVRRLETLSAAVGRQGLWDWDVPAEILFVP